MVVDAPKPPTPRNEDSPKRETSSREQLEEAKKPMALTTEQIMEQLIAEGVPKEKAEIIAREKAQANATEGPVPADFSAVTNDGSDMSGTAPQQ